MMTKIVRELEDKFEELSKQSLNLIKAMDALALIKFEDTEKKRTTIEELRQMKFRLSTYPKSSPARKRRPRPK